MEMALLLLSRTCNAPILRITVLKQDSRKEIFRTFARRHTLKKQARTPPTNRSKIFRTCVDEKPANALHTRVSCRRILKEQVMTPPIVAEFYKVPSLFSRAYNGLILRVKVLKQRPRVQIFRHVADKLDALRTRLSHNRILQEQVMAPAKSKEINKMVSLFSKVSNVLTLRLKILQGISPKHVIGTIVDKSKGTLHNSVSRILPKEQISKTNKPAEFYKVPSLFSKVYNGLILRVKVLNQSPRMQIFRPFADKLSAFRTRLSHNRILREHVMATAKSKEINKMISSLFSKVSTVLTLRFKILQGISLKHIFGTFVAKSKDNLHSSVSRIPFKEQISNTNNKLVESNKLASSLFGRIYNDLTLRLKVLKPDGRKQIFGRLTYESPISALRLHRHTNKRLNIDKGALTIFSVGIGTLFIYNLGLLNQPYNVDKYVHLGCSIAIAVPSAMAAVYSPVIMNILTRKGVMTQVINMLAIIGTGVVAQNIEYSPGFGFKQLAWLLNASVVGIMFTPLLVGPFSRRAMHATSVFVGLYITAACAPKETLYDPINEAFSIFRDICNILIKIAMLAKAANKNK